jgi:hypothetical protein
MEIMGGARLLFLTNLVAIVASAFLVLLLVGMSTPEVRQAMVASRGDDPLARTLSHGPAARIARLVVMRDRRLLPPVAPFASSEPFASYRAADSGICP